MEWISIKETHPQDATDVLFATKTDIFIGYLREIEGKTCLCDETGYGLLSDSGVEYWMPLPNLPKNK